MIKGPKSLQEKTEWDRLVNKLKHSDEYIADLERLLNDVRGMKDEQSN